jgi:hypothetical protein
MKTADAVPVDSTRKALPEMPYMPLMRPPAYTGPKPSAVADTSKAAAGDYYYEMGAGRVQSGWLTLAAKSAKGYGTMGQAEVPVSYIHPLQAKTEADCKPIYLGVIAYPLLDLDSGVLALNVAPVAWKEYLLTANTAKAVPTAPALREAAAFLAAGAASIALAGMSLF